MKKFLLLLMLFVSFGVKAENCFCLYDGPKAKKYCEGECLPIRSVVEQSESYKCKMDIVEIEGKEYRSVDSCRNWRHCRRAVVVHR